MYCPLKQEGHIYVKLYPTNLFFLFLSLSAQKKKKKENLQKPAVEYFIHLKALNQVTLIKTKVDTQCSRCPTSSTHIGIIGFKGGGRKEKKTKEGGQPKHHVAMIRFKISVILSVIFKRLRKGWEGSVINMHPGSTASFFFFGSRYKKNKLQSAKHLHGKHLMAIYARFFFLSALDIWQVIMAHHCTCICAKGPEAARAEYKYTVRS